MTDEQTAATAGALPTQRRISDEIAALHATSSGSPHPDRDFAPYRSSRARHPLQPLVPVVPSAVELSGPVFGPTDVSPFDSDLTTRHRGEPLGERIIVHGRVLDRAGRPIRGQLVEIWQANAAGRYAHQIDQHPVPLDPNFTGVGRALTDSEGHYRFVTIRPGAYPWRNHQNAWRPAHIHFSLFGTAFTQRLVTQMYFPGDPLFPFDPIFNSISDDAARQRLVARFDHAATSPEWALAYQWDIVLDGPRATWVEEGG